MWVLGKHFEQIVNSNQTYLRDSKSSSILSGRLWPGVELSTGPWAVKRRVTQ